MDCRVATLLSMNRTATFVIAKPLPFVIAKPLPFVIARRPTFVIARPKAVAIHDFMPAWIATLRSQ